MQWCEVDFGYINGMPATISFNGNTIYYVTNGQGDITAITDSQGIIQVTYYYDAWGATTSIYNPDSTHGLTLATINPLRYRGYVYDWEVGLYYLQSRYYIPEIGRFLNAGELNINALDKVLDFNLFAYCFSNAGELLSTVTHKDDLAVSIDHDISDIIVCDIGVYYDVPLYYQGSYSLCWAFCQVMIEDFYSGTSRDNMSATMSAIEIAISVYGDNWNQGGWPTNSSNPFSERGKPTPSLNEMYNILVNSGPVYAYYRNNDSAHLVVITGVNLSKGIIYTNNPWGIAGEQNYQQFLNGFAGMPSSLDMWFGFLIYPF